jgi:S1-C subfamily serine protease
MRSLLVALALASCSFAAGCAASSAERVPSASPSPLDDDPFVRSFRTLRPTVVLFTMNVPSDDKRRKGAFDEAYGSGVVVASGTWGSQVLTAEHVIHDASHLRATLDDSRVVPARVIAADEKRDLALVQIAVPDRPIATLGASARIEPGTAVGLAGYPIPDAFEDEKLGERVSVYAGRVSSVRDDALELDLPVIPGESGGPIFIASTGVVIGLAESRFDDEKAIGFAVPIEDAEHFLRGKLR